MVSNRPQAEVAARQERRRKRQLSLSLKVPLVAAMLVLLVAAAISIAAYFEVRHTARNAAYLHLDDIATLVDGQMRRNSASLVTTARATATRPGLAEFVHEPDDPARRVAALAALLTRDARQQNQPLSSTEIRDPRGVVLLDTSPYGAAEATDFPPRLRPGDSSAVGTMRLRHDSIVYPVSYRIPGADGAYIVQWRHATSSTQNAAATRKLIGAGATLLLGNADGTMWTDLSRKIAGPPIDPRTWHGVQEYRRAGHAVVGEAVPLQGTPLIVAIEFPLNEVMAPAQSFLRGILGITLFFVLLGVLGAWWFARRLTNPLRHLTDAADAISNGQQTEIVMSDRADELGRLARSFGAMSVQVRESRARLEDKVSERTAELNAALRQLQDAQEALLRREKLAMLGQLAGGVGHELRNPLGVMSNTIHYLDMVLRSSPDDIRDQLRLLREQVTLSSKIVNDLLDFARVKPAQRRPVTLRSIVDAQVQRLPERDKARVATELDDRLPAVEVDPVHIGQVVFNLLTNAVQAVDDRRGRLRISGHAVANAGVELHVSDNGPGIAPEFLERIFEPLFTTKARGIGLGLAVSRALAQANDGDLTVTSELGRGATFVVRMPAAA